jgi:hypothetical protein
MLAVGVGREGAIGGAFDEKLPVAFEEKLGPYADPWQRLHGVNG